MKNILPDCRTRDPFGRIYADGETKVPFYCGNCGAKGGHVTEAHCTFAFWLCPRCERLGTVAGMMAVPDEVFFERVKQAQLEEHGQYLNETEIARVLDDPSNALSKLAREAPKGRT